MSDNSVLDLDALVPQTAKIKFGGQEVEVKPPKTADILRLSGLGQKMQVIDTLPDDEIEALITSLTETITKMIPELAGQELNTQQLLKLTELLSQMVMPPDAKELEERGITPSGSSDPKDQSA